MQTSKKMIIQNGVLHISSTTSSEIIIQDNNITINPLSHSKIILCIINNTASCTQNITVNFQEQHAEVCVFGLYQGCDKQTLSVITTMNHAVPHCTSRQLWKGVLRDAAKASFEGKIIVAKHAQKTAAHLSNKNLLLSKTAEVSTRPFLEIDANDVQCTHGATVGCLDQDAIFYLRSRGIAEQDARELLIDAFVNEILELTPFETGVCNG